VTTPPTDSGAAQIYYQGDLDTIRQRTITVIGYGSQGRAHALNLRDSGCDVIIGLYPGSRSWATAEADGFGVMETAAAAGSANAAVLMVPDQLHRQVFASIQDRLAHGSLLVLAHGFSVVYGEIDPPDWMDVILVAPVGPGRELRQTYTDGTGIPAVFAVHSDASGRAERLALAYAAALGCTRAGVIKSTFREETETDLFGEQAVLVGGLAELIRSGFDTMVQAGYKPELAYFEAIHQVKLIVDLIYRGGLGYMYDHISDTAEFGAYLSGPRVVDAHVRENMRAVLRDVQNGNFAARMLAEFNGNMPVLTKGRRAREGDAMEDIGRRLRQMMPWLRETP
jgi:ketol-acid reductoisomerase